jgi:hypothetical protein
MKFKLPPTAVEIIMAEDLKGAELSTYFQLNFLEFGALVVDITDDNQTGIESFVDLMVESFYRGVEQFRKDQLDTPDNGKLASILTTPSGKLQ